MKFYIFAYKNVSEGARLLKQELGAKLIRKEGSRFRAGPNKTVINWGTSQRNYPALNQNTKPATNKLACFNVLKEAGVSIPGFTTDFMEAREQWPDFLARCLLTSSEGRGIVECKSTDESVPAAPLFVQYIKKKYEFRVHVMMDKVIHVQQKRRRNGAESSRIRSHRNGYVFCVPNVDVPPSVTEEAIKAVRALALHFGAVDVIYNQSQDKAYVLEVNTAPGLCETTAKVYANAFIEAFQ